MTNTTESYSITIPAISLPFFTTPSPINLNIPISTLKTLLRLIVIIGTYLLFRPHLERTFKRMTGRGEPTAAEVQERMKFIEKERGMPIGGGKLAGSGGAGSGAGGAQMMGGGVKTRRKA